MKNKFYTGLSMTCLLLIACSGHQDKINVKVDIEKEKSDLIAAHNKDRQAHFNKNPSLMLENSVDTFIYVGAGKVNYNRKADRLKVIAGYFKDAAYSKWDTIGYPIIRISDDATLAWMITRLDVRRTQKDSTGNMIPQNFIYAGVMMYKKIHGRWVKEANVSTFEPQ